MIFQILLLDIVFSLDSVITAVGMANDLAIMVTAMVIAMLVMLVSAGTVSRFIDSHPSLKILALAFLLLIGVMLVAEGMGSHIEKGYIYFAMAFSLLVELVNMRYRRKQGAPAPARRGRSARRPRAPLPRSAAGSRVRATTTGPTTSPMGPKALSAADQSPRNTGSVEIWARPEMKSGRTTLSALDTTATLQAARKSAATQRPCRNSTPTAGTQTSVVPTNGISEATAAIAPNTTGDGSPTSAKPMPTSTPWTTAVSSEPNTTARVTAAT